jgi:rhomboid protease GluP
MNAQPITPQEFEAHIHRYTPRTWVTPALIGINAAVYVAMVISGVKPLSPTTADILKWGANYAPLSLGSQPSRLLTCMFVHIGLLHIAMNMYVLWDIGRFIEKLLGNAGMFIVYLLAGLTGSLASVAIHPEIVSAGASGAIFGLYGALFGFLLRNRNQVPGETVRRLRKVAGLFVLYNILFGVAIKGIDLSAHLGGLFGGFVFGFLISGALTDAAVQRRPWRNLITAAVGVLALGAAARSLPPPADFEAALRHVADLEKQLNAQFQSDEAQMNSHRISGMELASRIQTEIQPPWQAETSRIAGLRLSGREAQARQKLLDYMRARDGYYAAAARARSDPSIPAMAALESQGEACVRLGRDLTDFLTQAPPP